MIAVLITIVGVIAIIAVLLWYVRTVNIGPPLIYVIYAGVAIACIILIVWVMDRFGGGFMTLH